MSKEIKRMSLREWVEAWKQDKFASPAVDIQIEAGWWDWFCSDDALYNRLKKMAPAVCRIAKSPKINPDKVYVFFENHQPMVGPLYDEFKICDLLRGDVLYCVTFTSNEQRRPIAEVWGKDNAFDNPLREGSMGTVYAFFGV